MSLQKYTSHISLTSVDNNNEEKKSKGDNNKLEKYIKRLILISMRTKKYYEKHDYFYEEEKRRKFDLKNLKIKLTPFQKYQIYKTKRNLTTEKFINNSKRVITSCPINNQNKKNLFNRNLITINNFNIKHMRKNKTHTNNQFYHTHNNFFYKPKNILFSKNELTESNDINEIYSKINNNTKSRAKSNYQTINILRTNKIIQTAESKKKINDNVRPMLDKFPILDIFNIKSKYIRNFFGYKYGKGMEEKKMIPLVDFKKHNIKI